MPKVSVIVPVYKVEAYLDKCVESILHQTYSDWELILVDDGSPDRSGAMCDAWAERDKRIKVFHKENGGVSSARNLGIEKAEGTWITFVDADDSLGLETLEKCAIHFDKADLIRFSMKFIYSEDGKDFKDFVLPALSHDEYLSRIVARETILGVCGGFYLRKMFVEHNIRFDKNLISGEDWVVLAQLVVLSSEISFISDTLYCYNKVNESSCTSSYNFKRSYSTLYALMSIENYLNRAYIHGCENALSRAKCKVEYDFYSSIILRVNKVSKQEIDRYASLINMPFHVIWDGSTSLKMRIFLLFSCNRLGRSILKIFPKSESLI